MQYLKVKWNHNYEDEPIWIYSEIDDERSEIRKIEVYRDNSFGLASREIEFGGTLLGLAPMPLIQDIQKEQEFDLYLMDASEFEGVWSRYINYLQK